MERKILTVPLVEAKMLGDGRTFCGYSAVFGNTDLQDDIVEPGAFKKPTLDHFLDKGFIAWMHDWATPVAIPTVAKPDDKGLYIEAVFHTTPAGEAARTVTAERLAMGKTMGISMGYGTKVATFDYETGIRHLVEVDPLYESSLVTMAANQLADVTGLKSIKGLVPFQDLPLAARGAAWDGAAAEKRVREWADATDEANKRYARAFLWFDSDAPDKFGSYKLPYADVVDGKLTAVPKAIFAAAGVVQGARGGVDIPDADMVALKTILTKWYSKMAEAFDDEDITPPWKSLSAFTGHREFVTALTVEAEALKARRVKDGRELSAANLAKLRTIQEQIQSAGELLTTILADKSAGRPSDADILVRARRLKLAV